MTTARLIFCAVLLSLLGLGAFCGVLPTRAGLIRRREDPKWFGFGVVFYFGVIVAIAWIG